MKRRKFLVGLGSTGAAGSALIGSGAFSQIDAQRSVTIQTATDPNAYLGLDKCNTPNGSYAHLDDLGHLKIFMDDENPTIGNSPLGEGVNSDSTSWFDRVFRICNQGKQDVCVHIEDDDDWPTVSQGPDIPDDAEGQRRVEFYLEDDDTTSLIGEDNAIPLPLGECVCVGIKTRTYGLSDGDMLLGELANEITIVADVDGDCFTTVLPECPMYGTSRTGSDEGEVEIWSIRYDSGTDSVVENIVGDIPDNSSNQNYPNGLAFDPDAEVWYFTEEDGILKTMNEDGCLGITVYNGGSSISGGESIAGATVYDGAYYFTPQGGDSLFKVDLNPDGSVVENNGSVTTDTVRDLPVTDITFGDVAADETGVLYFSVNGAFFKVDLNDASNDAVIVSGESDRDRYAVLSQLAFDDSGTLWAHDAGDGEWRTVDLTTGEVSDVVDTTKEYTDLATCGTFTLNDNCGGGT